MLPRPRIEGVRWEPSGFEHVTLRFLGRSDPDVVAAALGVADLPAATAVVSSSVGLLGSSVLCVTVDGLAALADAVVVATTGIGEAPPSRPFVGHITVGRLRRAAGIPTPDGGHGGEVTAVGGDLGFEELSGGAGSGGGPGGGPGDEPALCSFAVTEVALVRSHLPDAVNPRRRYDTLARFGVAGGN